MEFMASAIVFIAFIFLIIALTSVIYAGYIGTTLYTNQKTCLDAGYPDIEITYDHQLYCVKRINETDYVVPIEEIKEVKS